MFVSFQDWISFQDFEFLPYFGVRSLQNLRISSFAGHLSGMMIKQYWKILWSYSELIFWVCALVFLYLNPVSNDHFTLCPFSASGIAWCPGCGLGHSIHFYLHFDFAKGWEEHYLGAFAIFIILYRIVQLLIFKKINRTVTYGEQNI